MERAHETSELVGERFDVAIIGAGAIGATLAYELTRRGATVAVLEQGEDWAPGCSRGNAGWICPSHAGHYASRRDLLLAMRWMLRDDTPFGFKPRPALLGFGVRLLRSSRPSAVSAVRELLQSLAMRSLVGHAALARAGLDTGFRQEGLLDVYRTPDGLVRGKRAVAAQARAGLAPRLLSAAEVVAVEPALSGSVAGAILYPNDAHCDPLKYVRAVGRAAVDAGSRFLPLTKVVGRAPAKRGITLETSSGRVSADVAILAAGAHSAQLAHFWNRRIPLEAGKGYVIDMETERALLKRPLMLQEDRVAVTPLAGRLRLAGTMQFEGLDARVHAPRVRAIRNAAARCLPATSAAGEAAVSSGLRPCAPDGLPIVGWLGREPQTVIASGHAMLGLTLAPVTAQLVADLIEGRRSRELELLDPSRFATHRRRLGRRVDR